MREKAKYLFVVFLIFSINISLYYTILVQEYIKSIFECQLVVYLFIAILINGFFYLLILFFMQKKQVLFISNNVKTIEKEYYSLHKEFKKKLEEEIDIIKKKDKVIYEQSKLLSMKELINNISHQWRQPLSIISVAATSLQFEEENGIILNKKKILDVCTMINENVQYLSATLDNFNNFSSQQKQKNIFKLKSFLHQVFGLTNLFHDTYNIQMGYDLKKDISICSYQHDLTQVLLNIFNNSKEIFEYREIQDRFIFVEIDADEKYCYIHIKDSAGGIDESIMDRVFEPYFTTKHQAQGVGLGLYLSYVIVTQKLQGEIRVFNTTFEHELCEKKLYGVEVVISVPIVGQSQ